jgi:hypothetical protein
MKPAKYLLALWILFLGLSACSSAEKAANERRNLMMPEKSEIKRNSKYKPAKSKKTYKTTKKKNKKNKR